MCRDKAQSRALRLNGNHKFLCRSPRDSEPVRGRPNRLSKPAAAFTAGAIMNLQMNAENRIALEQVKH